MPRKSKSSKKSGRKRVRRTLIKNQPRGMGRALGIARSIIPAKMPIKMRFNTNKRMTITAGALATLQFRGNSLYDPDYTGAGGQPQYYDQLSLLYNKYRISGSKIKVIFQNVDATSATTQVTRLVVGPRSTSSMYTTIGAATEAPDHVQKVACFSGNAPGVITKYMKTSRIEGIPSIGVKIDDGFAAAVTTSPTNEWFWTLYAAYFDAGLAVTSNVIVDVTITYYGTLFDRKVVEDV